MPYNTVCSYSFLEAHTGALGGTPRRFRVSFSRLDWQPAPVEIRPDSEPLELEWIDSDDNVFTPTRALRATFNLTVEGWNPAILNASGKYDIQVLIECDQTGTENSYAVFFIGWVETGDAKDSYSGSVYGKTIYATDGLSLLKDKPVVDSAGRRLSGDFLSLASVLQFALAQTGYYRPLTAAVNLYHLADFAAGQTINGHPNPARCPLDRTRLKPDRLTTDKNDTVVSIDAIQQVLAPFGCRLGQWGGDWLITRVVELDGLHNIEDPLKQSVLARRYNSPGDFYAGPGSRTSLDLRVTVGKKESGEAVRVLSGSPQETLSSVKEAIKIEQSFGRFVSDLPNGNLSVVDGTGLPAGWYRAIFTADQAKRVGTGTELDPYKLHIKGAGTETNAIGKTAIGVRIQFPTGITTILPQYYWQKKWTLKGIYQVIKARSAQISVFARRTDGLYLATGTGEWLKNPAPKDLLTIRFDNSVIVNGTRVNNPAPTPFSITFNPIDKITDLYILFHEAEDLERADKNGGQNDPGAYTDFWNLSLSTEKEGLNLEGQSAVRTLPNRAKVDTVSTLTLGDVPDAASPYNHLGTLFDTAGNATGIWREGRSTLAADSGKSLINVLADDTARQVMNVQPGFEGDVLGYLPYGPFSVLQFTDIGEVNKDNLFVMHLHAITRWRYKARSMVNTVSCVRIASDSVPFGPQPVPGSPKAYWQTPNGEVLQNTDSVNSGTAAPTEPPIANPFPIPPGLLDTVFAGLNLPRFQALPGVIASGAAGNVFLTLDSGTGAPPAFGIDAIYRPVPENLFDYLDNG